MFCPRRPPVPENARLLGEIAVLPALSHLGNFEITSIFCGQRLDFVLYYTMERSI